MTKKILFMLLMLVVVSFLSATEYLDVVETKDGNIYKGVIIENKIDQYIKIELSGGSTFKIQYSDIDTIFKEAKKDDSTEGRVVITNVNTNTQTQAQNAAVAAAANVVKGNPYTRFELDALFDGKTLLELKDLIVDTKRMADTENNLKYAMFDTYKKDNAGTALALNIFLPGVGSFTQGNSKIGLYQSLSYVAYLIAFFNDDFFFPDYYDDSYYEDDYQTGPSGITIVLSVNYLAAFITGLVAPYSYQDKYNGQLISKLLVY